MKKTAKIYFFSIIAILILGFSAFHFPGPIREKLMQNGYFSNLDTKINKFFHAYYIKTIPDNAKNIGPGNSMIYVPDSEHFSFAVFGDTQMFNFPQTNNTFKQAVASLKKNFSTKPIAALLTTGDLINRCDGDAGCADYKLWKNIAQPFVSITYEVMGNHDHFAKDLSDSLWQNYFNLPTNGPTGYQELTYSFNLGNSHFIILDSEKNPSKINQDQRNWLENDLQKNTQKNTFVFFHEPAFPVSYKIKQSLDSRPTDRNALWAILDKYNVTAVFNGHEHTFSIEKIDNTVFPSATNTIHQIIIGDTDATEMRNGSPSPLAQYYVAYQHHYLIVDVNGKEIKLNLYSTDGTLVKTFDLFS